MTRAHWSVVVNLYTLPMQQRCAVGVVRCFGSLVLCRLCLCGSDLRASTKVLMHREVSPTINSSLQRTRRMHECEIDARQTGCHLRGGMSVWREWAAVKEMTGRKSVSALKLGILLLCWGGQ